jgi:hypothetical protein
MNEPTHKLKKVLVAILILFFVVNIGYLNYRVLLNKPKENNSTIESNNYSLTNPSLVPEGNFPKASSISTTEENISDLVKEATMSLSIRVDKLEKSIPVKNETVNTNQATTGVKEYYIPLGSGSASSSDWIDLTGVEANVAPSNYGKIKEMYFEANIKIPTGNGTVFARLKNVTDNTGLFESEVHQEGNNYSMVSSGKIPVPITTKLYRVQLKSSLGALAVLDSARIKIFVE